MKKNPKKVLIPKVVSIADLIQKATTDDRYKKLAMVAASNLGGSPKDLREARQWLHTNALESPAGEKGVVQEINFCRDLIDREEKKSPPAPPPPKDERCYVGCTAYLRELAAQGKSFEEIQVLADKKFHPMSLGGVKLILTGSRTGTKIKEPRVPKAAPPKRAAEQIREARAKLPKTPPAKVTK